MPRRAGTSRPTSRAPERRSSAHQTATETRSQLVDRDAEGVGQRAISADECRPLTTQQGRADPGNWVPLQTGLDSICTTRHPGMARFLIWLVHAARLSARTSPTLRARFRATKRWWHARVIPPRQRRTSSGLSAQVSSSTCATSHAATPAVMAPMQAMPTSISATATNRPVVVTGK